MLTKFSCDKQFARDVVRGREWQPEGDRGRRVKTERRVKIMTVTEDYISRVCPKDNEGHKTITDKFSRPHRCDPDGNDGE